MNINDVIKGFRIINVTNAEEVKGVAYEMVHEKTKAKLIWLKRDDDNKTFAITFKTLPTDDTGVFHILEHSVLNGSEKFPLKEPFVDLLKGSLQTFLNAMTFSDKTMYPVSSRNDQDFVNLMRVYLDGVFYPLVKKNQNTFSQEGWHYEITDPNEPIGITGVVYSEMQGAFSSPEKMMPEFLMTALFPDNNYRFISGGNPDSIPELTYEQFCKSHDKFYHPTNSYIWLDGDIDIENILGIIDEEYLSNFQENEEQIELVYQKPIERPVVYEDYAIDESSEIDNKSYAAFGYVIGDFNDIEKVFALNIIGSILTNSNESPLKKAIIEKDLAQDLEMGVNDGILQPYVEIDVYNTNPENYDEIEKTIKEVLVKTANEGLDKEEIIAYLNMFEFSSKERDFGSAPKGLVFGIQALNNWLYGGDPLDQIQFNQVFKSLREKVNTSYFDNLITECILNSKHYASIVLKPNKDLGKQKQQALEERLAKYKESLSAQELNELISFNEELVKWQSTEDSKEAKDTLPKLTIADVNEKPSKIDYSVEKVNDVNTLMFKNDTEGINYQTLFFNIDDKRKEDLQNIALVIKLLPELSTTNYDVLTFSRLRKTYIGSTSISMGTTTNRVDESYTTSISVSYSCLETNDDKALELVNELMYNVKFDDLEAIKRVLKQEKSNIEMAIAGRGHSVGLSRVTASLNEAAAVNEYITGLEYYYFVKETLENLSEKSAKEFERVYKDLFTTNRLTLSIMGLSRDLMAGKIINSIKYADEEIKPVAKPLLERKKEGVAVMSSVALAQSGSYAFEQIKENDGCLMVANKILSLDYLWTNIRAMGGAYGCGVTSKNGCLAFYSFRDPNPKNSLEVYKNAAKYLRELCEKDFDLTQYIIGTIGDGDPLLTNSTIMLIGNSEYFSKNSYEDRCNRRKRILSTKKEDLLRIADMFEQAANDSTICVVGGKNLLEQLDLDVIYEL